jgi:hypothetical protein
MAKTSIFPPCRTQTHQQVVGPATASVENGALLNHLGLIALAGIVSTIAVSKVGMVPIVHQRIPPGNLGNLGNSKVT